MSASLLGAFILASVLVVISPGPATLYVLRRSEGPLGEPVKAVAGIVAGDVVLISLSAIGVAALVMRFPELASAMKLAGAGYVTWVGLNLLTSGQSDSEQSQPILRSSLAGGFLITLSNPKAILFFAAFFPLFMDGHAPAGGQLLRLGAIFEMVNLAFYGLFIVTARSVFRRIEAGSGKVARIIADIGLLVAASAAAAATLAGLR